MIVSGVVFVSVALVWFLGGALFVCGSAVQKCALEFSDAREKFLRENWLVPVGRLAKYL